MGYHSQIDNSDREKDVLRPLNNPELGESFLEAEIQLTPEQIEESCERVRKRVYESLGIPPDVIAAEVVPPPLDLNRIEQIKIRVQLAGENRLLMPLTFYVNDVTYLLQQLGIEVETE